MRDPSGIAVIRALFPKRPSGPMLPESLRIRLEIPQGCDHKPLWWDLYGLTPEHHPWFARSANAANSQTVKTAQRSANT